MISIPGSFIQYRQPTHIFIKHVCIVLNIISQDVGWCADDQGVPVLGLRQHTSGYGRHRLVNVEKGDLGTTLAEGHPTTRDTQPLVWVVYEHLQIKQKIHIILFCTGL